jgi:hypothetical protein
MMLPGDGFDTGAVPGVAAVKRTKPGPQTLRAIKALDALAALSDSEDTKRLILAHKPLVHARFGEKGNALAAMGDDTAPRRLIPVLTITAAAQYYSGDATAAAVTLDEAIEAALKIPPGIEPTRDQYLMKIAETCSECGHGAGAVRAVDAFISFTDANPSSREGANMVGLLPGGTDRSRDVSTSAVGMTDKALKLAEAGFILEACGQKSAAVKAYVRLVEQYKSDERVQDFALGVGVAGLIRCGDYEAASRIVKAFEKHEWRVGLSREIALAQSRSGDAEGAMKTAEALGDVILACDMHLAAGRKATAIRGYQAALKALSPMDISIGSGAWPRRVRPRLALLAHIGRQQARAGARSDAAATFARAVSKTRETAYLRTPTEFLEIIAKAQLSAGFAPGPFPRDARTDRVLRERRERGQSAETAELAARVEKVFGFEPYIHVSRTIRPISLWAVLGSGQFRKGDKAAARESYARFQAYMKPKPTPSEARTYGHMLALAVVDRVDAGDVEGAAAMVGGRPDIPLKNETVVCLSRALYDAKDSRGATEILKRLNPDSSDYFRSIELIAQHRFKRGDLSGALEAIRPVDVGWIRGSSPLVTILRAGCAQGLHELVKPHAGACSGDLPVRFSQILARSGRKTEAVEMLQSACGPITALTGSSMKAESLLSIAGEMASLGEFEQAVALIRQFDGSNGRGLGQIVHIGAIELLCGDPDRAIALFGGFEKRELPKRLVKSAEIIARASISGRWSVGGPTIAPDEGSARLYAESMEFISSIVTSRLELEPGPVVSMIRVRGRKPAIEAIRPIAKALRDYRRTHEYALPVSLEALAAWAKLKNAQIRNPRDASKSYVFVKGLTSTEPQGTILIYDPVPDASGRVATICVDGLVSRMSKADIDRGVKRNKIVGKALPSGAGLQRAAYGSPGVLQTRRVLSKDDTEDDRAEKCMANLSADLRAYAHFNGGTYPASLEALRKSGMLYDRRDIEFGGGETFPILYFPGVLVNEETPRALDRTVAVVATAGMWRLKPTKASRDPSRMRHPTASRMDGYLVIGSSGYMRTVHNIRGLDDTVRDARAGSEGLADMRFEVKPSDPVYLAGRKRAWNLRAALEKYAQAHGGKYPPSLTTLVSAGLVKESELRSPRDKARGYVYYAGQSVSSASKNILFYDPAPYQRVGQGRSLYLAARIGMGLDYSEYLSAYVSTMRRVKGVVEKRTLVVGSKAPTAAVKSNAIWPGRLAGLRAPGGHALKAVCDDMKLAPFGDRPAYCGVTFGLTVSGRSGVEYKRFLLRIEGHYLRSLPKTSSTYGLEVPKYASTIYKGPNGVEYDRFAIDAGPMRRSVYVGIESRRCVAYWYDGMKTDESMLTDAIGKVTPVAGLKPLKWLTGNVVEMGTVQGKWAASADAVLPAGHRLKPHCSAVKEVFRFGKVQGYCGLTVGPDAESTKDRAFGDFQAKMKGVIQAFSKNRKILSLTSSPRGGVPCAIYTNEPAGYNEPGPIVSVAMVIQKGRCAAYWYDGDSRGDGAFRKLIGGATIRLGSRRRPSGQVLARNDTSNAADGSLRKICSLIKVFKSKSKPGSMVGVAFGPKADVQRDPRYVAFVEKTEKQFATLIGDGKVARSSSSGRSRCLGGLICDSPDTYYIVLYGIDRGRCVSRWFVGSKASRRLVMSATYNLAPEITPDRRWR